MENGRGFRLDRPSLLYSSATQGLRMLARPRSRNLLIPRQPVLSIGLLFLLVASISPSSALAQGGNLGGFGTLGGVEPVGQYPAPQYYLALEIYRRGDLVDAIDAFENALRSGRRDIRGRWIDSIPALAMLAECNWHLGNVPAARDYCDQALQIAIANRGWLGRVDWQSVMQPGVQLSTPQWLWPEAGMVRRVPVSDRVTYRSGRPLTEQVLRRGGEIEEMNLRTMDIVEIARGLAVAAHRRRVLLGPLAEGDPLAAALLDATKYPAGLQVPIARTLIGSLRTNGYFSVADDKRAIEEGAQNAMFSGSAHPLSAVTLLSQISALAGSDNAGAIPTMALNAANVAAASGQPEFIGDAMQLAAGCASGPQAAAITQAARTVAGAMMRESSMATLHCLIAGADAAVTSGDLDSAAALLSQAQTMGARRDVVFPRLGAYRAYVAARLAAAGGSSVGISQTTDFDEALNQIASFALNHRVRSRSLVSMPGIYQLGLVRQAIGTTVGGRTSDQLLKAYCDDPSIGAWRRDAVDALALLMVDRSVAHLARVNLAAAGGYSDKLLLATDQMLAARFRQRLPLGGRIAQVRALAGFDDRLLDKPAVEFRNKLGRAMADLRAASLAAGGADAGQADSLESQACQLAVSRTPLPDAVPPLLDEKLPLAKLPPRTGLLTFVVAGNRLHATLAAEGKVSMWTVAGSNRLPSEIGRLLREIGVGKTRGNRIPEDDSWKKAAVSLRDRLVPDYSVLSTNRFDQLIVVPDGPLWYLPFEILPLADEGSELLGDKMAIRYAPTPGLALKPVSDLPVNRATGLCADLFFAPRDPEQNAAIVQSIVDVIDDPIELTSDSQTPTSLLGEKVGHLVVAAPRNANTASPLLFCPAPYDQNSPYGTLAAWLRFPVQGPRTVVLSGMRTPIDVGKIGTGDEIFMTLCGLHVAGVRSVMVSRWAVGGESSAIALRELVQELPFAGLEESWRRARAVLRRSELNPAAEPLLIQAEHNREGLTGDQPLFWAGYLVSSPQGEERQ